MTERESTAGDAAGRVSLCIGRSVIIQSPRLPSNQESHAQSFYKSQSQENLSSPALCLTAPRNKSLYGLGEEERCQGKV